MRKQCRTSGTRLFSKDEKARNRLILQAIPGGKQAGDDGSRTRVQEPIPRSSTIIADYLTFPLPDEKRHPSGFSSFMIRPRAQSFARVVSHIVDAWVLKCECLRSDARP